MSNQITLTGKTALITGGASGIGAAIATTMAQAGPNVVITDIDETQAQDLASTLQSKGLKASFAKHNVTSETEWDNAISHTLATFCGLDVLVNNAGIIGGKLLEHTTLKEFKKEIAVNLEGVFIGMQQAAKVMKPGGLTGRGGNVINLSSVAGMIGSLCHAPYGATKGAVRLLSKHCAVEFAALGYNIRVNSIHPGIIETPMGDSVLNSYATVIGGAEAAEQVIMAAVPQKRLGKSQDVANIALFLASDAANYVTGAEFVVDGGLTAM